MIKPEKSGYRRVILFLILFLHSANALFGESEKAHRILLLHSYSTDYQWTSQTNEVLHQTIHELSPHSLIRTEFMDTKNYYSDEYIQTLVKLYSDKYAAVPIDGIIATDNNALYFLEDYGKELFPDTTIVACGINNALPPAEGGAIHTIIPEEGAHLETFRLGLKIRPEAEEIYVISDASPTGVLLKQEVQNAIAGFEENIDFSFIDGLTIKELEFFVSTRKKTDLIYILPFFKTVDNQIYSQGQVEKLLAESSTVPLLVSWSFQLNTGVLGGRVISSEHYGQLAAETLVDALNGKEVKTFYLSEEETALLYTSIFDYKALERFSLTDSPLPEDIVLWNKPAPFFQKHREVLLPGLLITGFMLLLIILLQLNLKKQKTINIANNEVLVLNRELIDTQQELVTTLGEVIEARSQETGNHVVRVCKISRLLGEKAGLTAHELDILEGSSSLHDVGKIGIPESVLQKPGKLDEGEFELIKTHTNIGREILKGSSRDLLKTAREIAFQHHEKWDGSGYPDGLKAEEISIQARITTLADIYDALSSDRCYKKAWPEEKVLGYIKSEKGATFEPQLVEIFMNSIDLIRKIREDYAPDYSG